MKGKIEILALIDVDPGPEALAAATEPDERVRLEKLLRIIARQRQVIEEADHAEGCLARLNDSRTSGEGSDA